MHFPFVLQVPPLRQVLDFNFFLNVQTLHNLNETEELKIYLIYLVPQIAVLD